MTSGTSISDKFYIFAAVLCITALFLVYDLYNSEMYQCARVPYSSSSNDLGHKYKTNKIFGLKVLDRDIDFDLYGNDVIVFLHIQKTGGTTFGKHLVKHLRLEQPCECMKGLKRCDCNRPGTKTGEMNIWLFSRYSTGWSCGLHADWTELKDCVPKVLDKKENEIKKRRYFYVTVLRNPVHRYISEWRHVQRSATWRKSLHMCDGRLPTKEELPKCYKGDSWEGVPLDEFMNCKYNLAHNRQTRMLADLSLVGCYNLSKMPEEERKQILLKSAKRNLRRVAFFGITEFQEDSQFLFEKTFKLNFTINFELMNSTRAGSELQFVTPQQMERIKQLNSLDLDLYQFAKDLFIQRKILMQAKLNNNGTLPF